jgi:anhydro-N-acetylmuramic acid kinase
MGRTLAELLAKDHMLVAGLCGGVSCDGVDAALCEISGGGAKALAIKLVGYHDEPFSAALRQKVIAACEGQPCPVTELCRLHFRLGHSFARAAEKLLEKAGRKPAELDLISSHGQTVSHLPPRTDMGIGATGLTKRGSTLQIAEPAMIAERLGVAVVSGFRARDIAAGGQGGPLAPYVDYLLYAHPSRTRVVVNIGGIVSVTYLPAGGRRQDILAFDAGPGSLLTDSMVQRTTLGKQRFDAGGALARAGHLDAYTLSELLKHPYLQRPPPKATGREEFGLAYARQLYEWGIRRGVKPSNMLRTATEFIAIAVAETCRRFLLPRGKLDDVILSGGGAQNAVLVERLRHEFGGVPVRMLDEFGVPAKAKQALVYAVLGREAVLGRPGNLPSATGAEGLRVLGQITPP